MDNPISLVLLIRVHIPLSRSLVLLTSCFDTLLLDATANMTLAEKDKIAATTYTGDKAEGIEGPRFGEKPETTLREDVAAYGLEKVYERHGRVDLVPLPS